jgi:hypothetical protein
MSNFRIRVNNFLSLIDINHRIAMSYNHYSIIAKIIHPITLD